MSKQPGGMESHRVRDDVDDAPIAHLEAVAERTVDHVAPPVFGQPVDSRELVHQTGRGQHPASHDGVAAHQLDPEAAALGASHIG